MVKILIIRFSSIGDIVLTSPVVRCIKEQINDAEIHFLSKESFQAVIEPNPYISKFHYLNNNYSDLLNKLKNEQFDHVIDLHNNIRSWKIKRALRSSSHSFPKLNLEKWLMVNFKINRLPEIHIVDRYFKTLQDLGVVNDGKGLDYFIPKNEEIDLKTLPPSFSKGYVAFVIGAKHQTKMFPTSKTIDVIRKYNKPVLILGGKEDQERAENIVRACKDNTFNAAGIYNINQSASFIRQALAVVTNDTGLMHIAAAFKKRTISVWGNTIPEFGMYPYIEPRYSKIIEVKDLSCRPCTKIGFDTCPKKHFHCMTMHNDNTIVQAIEELTSS